VPSRCCHCCPVGAVEVAAGVGALICAVASTDVSVQNVGVEEVVGRGDSGGVWFVTSLELLPGYGRFVIFALYDR
jgi:hypothetical protein